MNELYVSKFGGSSVASADKIKKIRKIINEDSRRRLVVVSALGKEDKKDRKETDILIDYANTKEEQYIKQLAEKNWKVFNAFGMQEYELEKIFRDTLYERANQSCSLEAITDSIKAYGEESTARFIADAFSWRYIDPKEYIVVSNDFGNARILDETYDRLIELMKEIKKSDDIFLMPGFYGYTKDGLIATLKRGGSDLTGAVVAAGINADLYENFTDQDGVLSAHPDFVRNPKKIEEMTYNEIRNLSYMGFKILQEDAMWPTQQKGIPIHIRNTNKYPLEGTKIVSDRMYDLNKPAIGVSYDNTYAFNVKNFGLNEQRGIVNKILDVIENKYKINVEFFPGAIDKQSFVFRKDNLKLSGEMITKIEKEIEEIAGKYSKAEFIKDSGALAIAGEGIDKTDVTEDVSKLLRKMGYKKTFLIEDEGYSIIEINRQYAKKAVNLVYSRFVK